MLIQYSNFSARQLCKLKNREKLSLYFLHYKYIKYFLKLSLQFTIMIFFFEFMKFDKKVSSCHELIER